MLDTLNFEQLSREEIEHQLWLHTQVVDFDSILHQNLHQSRESFAELIIHQLAKLTQALRGSFFLMDSSNIQLNAVAAYACALDNLPKTTFNIGEGLIGQTAKTKEVMYLEDLPKDNIFIESSLGRISVKSISIIPLVYNKQILGVVELLFLNNLGKQYQELLGKVAENIAVILYNIQNIQLNTHETPTVQVVETETNQTLIDEFHQKLEIIEQKNIELKSKNEDLKNLSDSIRVQNTNLSNQLEELNQENADLKKEQKEPITQVDQVQTLNLNETDLERLHLADETLMILDLDTEGVIIKASKKFLEMTQMQEEDLIGKTYDVTHHSETPVPLFEYVRQEAIREGNFQNCYRVARQDESNYWVKFQMLSVWDTKKQTQNFRLFFYEVTEELEKLSEVKQELRELLERKFELEQSLADSKMQYAEAMAEAENSTEEDQSALQSEVTSLQEKLAAQVEVEYELRDKLLSQMKVVEEVDTLRLQNSQLEEKVQNQVQKTEEIESLHLKNAELEEQLAGQNQNVEELEILRSKTAELEQQLAGQTSGNEELEALRSKVVELEGQLTGQTQSIEELEALRSKVVELEGQLTGQTQSTEELEALRSKVVELEGQLTGQTQSTEELEALRSKVVELEGQLTGQTQSTEELEALRSKVVELEGQLTGQTQSTEELEALRSKNAELEQLVGQSQNSEDLQDLRSKNVALEEQLVAHKQAHKQEIEVRLAQYAKNLDNYLLSQKTELEQELETLKNKLSQEPSNEEGIDRNLEELSRELDENRSRLQELEDARQALIARESLLNQVALVSETNLEGVINYANEKFCEVSQYPLEDLIGHPHSVIRHPDTPPEIFREMWDVIKQGKIFKGRFKNLRRDGSSFWVESNISPVLDETGNIIKYISIQLDITEEMQRKLGVFQEKNIFSE